MKKAVIYARYSSDSQSEQSIDGQLRVCKEYAERENIKIVDTYIDRAMTGTNNHRPDFKECFEIARRKVLIMCSCISLIDLLVLATIVL